MKKRTLPAQGPRHLWDQGAMPPFGDGGAGAEHKAEQAAFEATCIAPNKFSVSIPLPIVDSSNSNDDVDNNGDHANESSYQWQ